MSNKASRTVISVAPAKINLILEIHGTDSEGYHNLSTVFQALDLSDELMVTLAEDTALELVDKVHSGFKVELDDNNLVIKAQRLLEQHCRRPLPCHIKLIKNIPAGGGLGGGSADAASMLAALNIIYDLKLDKAELLSLAARLGADVAFGLIGGTALGTGRGERLSALPTHLSDHKVVLVVPPRGLSTPKVYAEWDKLEDKLRHPAQGNAEKYCQLARRADSLGDALQACLSNDLQPAAFAMYPELKTLQRKMLEAGCSAALLCGSGSTMFGLLEPQFTAKQIAELIAELSPLGRVVVTSMRSSQI